MFIKDSYLLAASRTFELKEMQEITVNIKLTKAPPCYHTLLTGKVLYKNIPVKGALVKVFDRKYNPLVHAVTNSKGVYQFFNILTPGRYKVIVTADGYRTTETRNIKIKKNKVINETFYLEKCIIFTNGILYGKVRESGSKKPIEGASIYLRDKFGRIYKTTSNNDGQYIIYNIFPGKYRLIAVKNKYITPKPLELSIGKNERIMLDINLKRQYSNHIKMIYGVVTCNNKPVPDVPVFLYQLDKKGHETIIKVQITNDDGTFLFSHLTEGTYRIKGKLQSGSLFERAVTLGQGYDSKC